MPLPPTSMLSGTTSTMASTRLDSRSRVSSRRARGRCAPGRTTVIRSERTPPRQASNRVLATILFTDLVDSTLHLARLGDRRWLRLLADHDRVVRHQIARFRGNEVKTTGDGFVATFDAPGRAIRAADAIVRAVHALGLELRVGLHCGEFELLSGDIGGIAVHIAQRISS